MSWNRSAERIFGYTAQEIIGQPIARLLPDDLLDEEDFILERLRAGKSIDHIVTRRLRKDGQEILVSIPSRRCATAPAPLSARPRSPAT